MTIPYEPFASNSPVKVRRAISWAEFLREQPIHTDNFSLNVTDRVDLEISFRALVVCTVYTKSSRNPGIHIFFATKLSPNATPSEVLFRGVIRKYAAGNRSSGLNNPYFTSAKYIRWGSIHRLQVSPRNRNYKMPTIDHLESLSPPPEDYQIPGWMRSALPGDDEEDDDY